MDSGVIVISTKPRLSLFNFNRFVEAGAFNYLGKRRIELIYGDLRELAPPGPAHAESVARLTRWSAENTSAQEANVRVHDPIEIPDYDSAPQPDIVWAKPKDYSQRHPQGRDVILVIEVADSSLAEDVGEMATLYAQAGIKDYWVINVRDFCVEIFRQPRRGQYTHHETMPAIESISPLAFPRVHLPLSGLFSGTL